MKYNNRLRTAAALLLTLSLGFSIACDKAKDKNSTPVMELPQIAYPLTLEKEKEYRFDVITKEGPIIGKVDDPDNLYVYFLQNQDNNCEIQKLSTDLELKEKFYIPRAVGPGEAQNPRIYGGDKNFIIVYDPPGFKYIKFDGDFKLLDEYKITKDMGLFLYSGGRYIKKGNFVLDGFRNYINLYDSLLAVFKMNLSDEKVGRVKDIKLFEIPGMYWRKDNNKMILGSPLNFGWFFEHIYILNRCDYRILKMDTEGNILIDKRFIFSKKTFSEKQRKEWINKNYPPGSRGRIKLDFPDTLWPACWLIQIGDGIAVGRMENYDPVERDFIPADYFDPDLNYLGRIKLPYFPWWNRTDIGPTQAEVKFYSLGGKLYFAETRDDDEYWIVRYAIEKI